MLFLLPRQDQVALLVYTYMLYMCCGNMCAYLCACVHYTLEDLVIVCLLDFFLSLPDCLYPMMQCLQEHYRKSNLYLCPQEAILKDINTMGFRHN